MSVSGIRIPVPFFKGTEEVITYNVQCFWPFHRKDMTNQVHFRTVSENFLYYSQWSVMALIYCYLLILVITRCKSFSVLIKISDLNFGCLY